MPGSIEGNSYALTAAVIRWSREAPGQVVVDQADGHGALADGGGDALDRPAADITDGEDPGHGGLQRQPPGCRFFRGGRVAAGEDEAGAVERQDALQPPGVRGRRR